MTTPDSPTIAEMLAEHMRSTLGGSPDTPQPSHAYDGVPYAVERPPSNHDALAEVIGRMEAAVLSRVPDPSKAPRDAFRELITNPNPERNDA